MVFTAAQLTAILARALPDEQLRASHALPHGRYALELAGGERLEVQQYASAEAAEAAAAALRMLRGEIDLPIPQLHASDPQGATVGAPYLLLSALPGEPLDQALPQIGDDALYQLGRSLGTLASRVHRLACPHYGPLTEGGAESERAYVLERVERDVRRCGALGMLDRRTGAELAGWFERHFQPTGRLAALVHGSLSPRCLLVRHSERAWKISGVLGWGQALGWSPAWEHVSWLDAADDPRYFSLRVGYGNAYDELTNRTYEQLREHMLAPYRLLLMLERLQAAHAAGNIAECERRRSMLRGLLRVLEE